MFYISLMGSVVNELRKKVKFLYFESEYNHLSEFILFLGFNIQAMPLSGVCKNNPDFFLLYMAGIQKRISENRTMILSEKLNIFTMKWRWAKSWKPYIVCKICQKNLRQWIRCTRTYISWHYDDMMRNKKLYRRLLLLLNWYCCHQQEHTKICELFFSENHASYFVFLSTWARMTVIL